MTHSFDILSRAAAGDPEAEILAARILLNANRQFFRNQGALSLQRCAGLPESMAKLLKQRRDYWLIVAFGCLDGGSKWFRCTLLAAEIERMLSVFWPRWKDLSDPPEEASQLRQALFRYVQIGTEMNPENPSIPSSAQQISNIVTAKFLVEEI